MKKEMEMEVEVEVEVEVEMEMRAEEDINIGEDITPPLPPLSFSLHDSFLDSHCSSCFSPLPSSSPLPNNPPHHVLYCSQHCSLSDSPLHLSSAEFHLLQSLPSTYPLSSDLRAALRLLHSLPATHLHRISGLLTNRHKFMSNSENENETSTRIRHGAQLMAAARTRRAESPEEVNESERDAVLEEAVLCLVLTNAVEVQDNSGRTLGIAVYDTRFSWINHSCSPNACYRFSVSPPHTQPLRIAQGNSKIGVGTNSVSPQGYSNAGVEGYGPRMIVRSIRPIKKGEEVTIAYTDLLQPKAMRQSELWSKYQFICCCKRCSASPQAYVDHALQEICVSNLDSSSLNSDHNFHRDEAIGNLTDYIDEAITEYLSVGDPECCCEKLERVLTQGLPDEQFETKEGKLQPNFRLQPLHHLALNAYTTLASAYKSRASDLLAIYSETDGHQLEAFAMSRTSAAYSLLLAGATNHLFCSESSLIASVANFWTSAGESLLILARSSVWGLFVKWGLPVSNLSSLKKHKCSKCSLMDRFEDNLFISQAQNADFENISGEFLDCVTKITQKVWSFLIYGCHHLEILKDPVDFSWLGKSSNVWDLQAHLGSTIEGNCVTEESISKCEALGYTSEERINIFQLAVHCLLYGGFLASICYGENSHLTLHIRNILHHEENLNG